MLIKTRLEELYGRGLSMMDIAERENLSNSGVKYLMDKYGIKRRSRSEATYLKRNPLGDPFVIKQRLSKKESLLKELGLGLYWGEGDKSPNNTQVRLGNTDPRLIKKFREFLTKIYGVKQKKFKYSLIIFNDSDKRIAIRFWENKLKIDGKRLGKVLEIPSRGKGTYRNKNKFGVFTLIVCNKKLKEHLLTEIDSIE